MQFASLTFLAINRACAWEDFYPRVQNPGVRSQMYRNKPLQLSNSPRFYISDSFFDNIYTNNNGALISIENGYTNVYLLVERVFFNNIYTPGKGGAICFDHKGECKISHVCAYDCGAEMIGCFLYIDAKKGSIECSDSAFSKTDDAAKDTSNYLTGNSINLIGLNISHVYTEKRSALVIEQNIMVSIQYASFKNCTSVSECNIYLKQGDFSDLYILLNSNIIDNHQKGNGDENFGILSLINKVGISECCFINNTGRNLLYFGLYGSCVLMNCYIDPKEPVDLKKDDFDLEVIDPKAKEFINKIEHLKTAKCEIEADHVITGNFIQTIQLTCKEISSRSIESVKGILLISIVASKA